MIKRRWGRQHGNKTRAGQRGHLSDFGSLSDGQHGPLTTPALRSSAQDEAPLSPRPTCYVWGRALLPSLSCWVPGSR